MVPRPGELLCWGPHVPLDRPLRVLIAEDSPIIAAALASVLDRDPGIEVVGMAADGKMAIEMVGTLGPDLVVMDVHMPVLGGLDAIERIMAERPVPILVCTADPLTDALSFEALRRGALELIRKPTALHQSSPETRDLCAKVKLLAQIPVVRRSPASHKRESAGSPVGQPLPAVRTDLRRAIGIVGSTGGPGALAELLGRLPGGFTAPVVVVQHLATGFAPGLASWLGKQCDLRVRVAGQGEMLLAGTVLIAPDAQNLQVSTTGRVMLTEAPPRRLGHADHVPSGDVLLASLARAYGKHAVGVVLSGMGEDGAEGLAEVARVGGATLVQSEASSVIFGMPRAALERGAAQRALAPSELARELCRLTASV